MSCVIKKRKKKVTKKKKKARQIYPNALSKMKRNIQGNKAYNISINVYECRYYCASST